MSFISSRLFYKVLNHAIKEGMSEEAFGSLPVPLSASKGPEAVPADLFFQLHEMVDDVLGPGFSVRVGHEMGMDDYGVLGLSWKTCSDARDVFARSERYFAVLSDTYVFRLEDQDDVSIIYLNREAHRRGVELSNEATFSATVTVLQTITETRITPVKVSFKHGPPKDDSDYRKCFNCPISYDQEFNFISYKKTDLDTRTAKADESINKFLLERVDEEARGIEVSSSKVLDDVRDLIKDALPSGIPSIGQLGEHLGMSSRTLSRRLAEGGITFRDLVKETQREISTHLLKHSSSSVGEIAFQTGFSEQSAFNRAFKNWTGLSPVSYRKT